MFHKFIAFILKSMAYLPLSCLYFLSDIIRFVLHRIVKYRKKVIRQNLTNAFPEKSIAQIKKIENNFYRFLADQMVETIKLFHISDKELKKRVVLKNYEIVNEVLEADKSAVILMGHYGNWEWVQEISTYFIDKAYKASIYHPLNHEFWNQLFISLRSRWGAHILPMQKAPRALLSPQNQPWVCGFIADAFTWLKHDNNWVEFLNQKTWFIYGPEEIGRKVKAEFFYLDMVQKKRGYYEITLSKLVPDNMDVPYPYIREFFKKLEATIQRNPALWLWSHKRWK